VVRSIDSKFAKTHIKKLGGITRITDVQKPEPEEPGEDINDIIEEED
jgi:hypothetical protein